MKRGIGRLQRRYAEVEAFDPSAVSVEEARSAGRSLGAAIDESLVQIFGSETADYKRYRGAGRFYGPTTITNYATPDHVYRDAFSKDRQRSLDLLGAAIKALEEQLEEFSEIEVPLGVTEVDRSSLRRVFIVHGHDDGSKEALARFLERIGFEPVILHEQPNKGRTIITKFQEEAVDIGFAVVLMTPDDHGGVAGAQTQPRARQNVVFELGFFIGALGPAHVAALVKGDVELPSDFQGVVYISLDQADWKAKLGQELQAAGYKIDWNEVMGP